MTDTQTTPETPPPLHGPDRFIWGSIDARVMKAGWLCILLPCFLTVSLLVNWAMRVSGMGTQLGDRFYSGLVLLLAQLALIERFWGWAEERQRDPSPWMRVWFFAWWFTWIFISLPLQVYILVKELGPWVYPPLAVLFVARWLVVDEYTPSDGPSIWRRLWVGFSTALFKPIKAD